MKRILYLFDQIWLAFLMISPNTYAFCRLRAKYYLKHGSKIGENTLISTNVRITGNFTLGKNSSIAQNCSISGASAGVFIGDNVMIAPSVVIVAFNHGFDKMEVPMLQQENTEKPVYIEDDIWIGANVTILNGVRIGTGSIVAANSLINKDVEPFSIVGGVPAKKIKSRKQI